MNKQNYSKPRIDFYLVEIEESIASASITPHLESSGEIEEVWEEDVITLPRVDW